MGNRFQKKLSAESRDHLPPLPIPVELWQKVAKSMKLSGQLSRIVEHVLRDMSDKEIEADMNIRHSTLRTYFDRIKYRYGLRGRTAILRHILTISHELNA